MARLVTKFKYLKPNRKVSAGGYAKYIATREGVEKIDDTKKFAPATAKQKNLIEKILKDFPDSKDMFEYADYLEKQNQGSASDFISRVMEDYTYEISGRKAYADYIATRPRAERFGSHGLFTDDGVQVQLSKVTQELDRHKGNIWTAIISIRREDAQRLGFNTGARWRDMLRTQTEALAKNLKIPMQNLRWYAAFHNESHHPHVHLIAYSTVENEGYLTQKGVENLRSSFAKDIFQQDLLCIYERQTEHRDKLRAEARDIVEDLVSKINSEIYISASIQHKLLELADRLSQTKGKKVYGYLKPDVKALVDSIVDELANDGRIKKLYDLWYEQKENTIRTYTDEIPDRISLAQNKEFKSIKNAVIKEALKLNLTEDEVEKNENTDEEPVLNPFEYEENTSAESDFDSDRGVLYPHYSIKTNRNSVAVSSLYLLRYLCNIIKNQLRFEEKQKSQRTDKKLQQKINDKKQAQGLKI
ncbi:MobP3 family relaxase [uncultured Ruminococcus sp.]|uniref:MobP3 family relaxase n=1 Tax=uncultured Ruminococcus sp. TaxID=165186 RepID=UPI0025ED9E89|nr:MobP3 family relaxase [uncultured Ruminococcus sp.]